MLKIQCFILSISRAWQCWAMIGFLLGFWAIFFVFLGRTLSFPLCLIRFAKKKFVFLFFWCAIWFFGFGFVLGCFSGQTRIFCYIYGWTKNFKSTQSVQWLRLCLVFHYFNKQNLSLRTCLANTSLSLFW
jgi:hypothetical protein